MYYPLSQITSNLYTNGEELIYKSSNSSYSGYYWKSSDGKYFTGKTPQDTPIEELILLSNVVDDGTNVNNTLNIISYYDDSSTETADYLNLKKPNSPPSPPYSSPTFPTQKNYQIGEMRRYFCKKTNEIIYLEINIDTYNKLVNQDSKILYSLYRPFNIPWKLIGDKTQTYITNKNIVELTMKQQKLPMFNMYLKLDYTKYYQK